MMYTYGAAAAAAATVITISICQSIAAVVGKLYIMLTV
jgi:hypothetical protein